MVIIDLSIVTMMLQQLRKIWRENITTVMSVEFIIMMVEMTIVKAKSKSWTFLILSLYLEFFTLGLVAEGLTLVM